jgi:hypothetical protein
VRRAGFVVTILMGLFFLLLPFIGSKPDPLPVENNRKSVAAFSFFFGLFVASVGTYQLVRSFRSDTD